jgi:CheY-like chemotaxis protein
MALVLCTGIDRHVMQTRAMLLERAGHKVIPAMGERELIEACARNKFDVVVVGHSVPPFEKSRVLRLIRQHCPNAKVLELFVQSQGSKLPDADDWLEGPIPHPNDLIERVATLAAKASSDSPQ